jgi:trafficking protein particle complex subunit 4
MVLLHLFIVNKSGGLIYSRSLSQKAPKIGTNEWLRIGSTFHSLHAIAAEASPLRLPGNRNPAAGGADDGIEEIQAEGMVLRCLQTRTGVKFVLTAEQPTSTPIDLDSVLREIYVLVRLVIVGVVVLQVTFLDLIPSTYSGVFHILGKNTLIPFHAIFCLL